MHTQTYTPISDWLVVYMILFKIRLHYVEHLIKAYNYISARLQR